MQVVPSTDGSSSQKQSGRNHGLDILRVALTALVILHHTAIVYGGDGSWYFIDKVSHRPLTTLLLSFFCALNQSFFMGLFFLLAGYFTPPAIARQGFATYAQDRLLRLGLPILVYGFLIGPLTLALARTGQGAEFLPTFTALLAQARFEIGPLWFLEALLLFAALYGLIWRWAWLPAWHGEQSLRSANLLLCAIAVGLCAFLLRLIWPVGQTVLALQRGYFASYILLFFVGCCAAQGQGLANIPPTTRRLWTRIALFSLPVLPLAFLLRAHIPLLAGDPRGGLSLQALIYAFWEPFVAWGIILTLLALFQQRFASPTPMGLALARRAYGAFIIHPPVIVALSLVLQPFALPPLLKFLATGSLSVGLSFCLAGLLVRIPVMKRVI